MVEAMTVCYVCSSEKFVDDHHYDCQRGKLSPETVPLCRRCHTTYHNWGIEAFSPDTTEKGLEIENKRREILRSLPVGHPSYQNLPPMKLEDVKRSSYWYKKHHITRPKQVRPKREIPFRIPNNPPLCGEVWLEAHLTDHTSEEIEALTIEIARDERWLPPVSVASKRGTIKTIMKRRL